MLKRSRIDLNSHLTFKSSIELGPADIQRCSEICGTINQCGIVLDIAKEIAEYSVGQILECKWCKGGNIFVMPSSILDAWNHGYASLDEPFICDNLQCVSPSYIHSCSYCNDSWWFSSKKLSETRDIGLPESYCVACRYENSQSDIEICRACEFICNGCYNGFCKKYHQKRGSCCIKDKCLNTYCERCSLFNRHAYSELLPIISAEDVLDINTKQCIVCVCGLDKLRKTWITVDGSNEQVSEYEYYYHFPHYKDRFNCYFIIELLKDCELVQIMGGYKNKGQIPSSINDVLRTIAVYATGFHFVDTEDVYIPGDCIGLHEICIGDRQCELSVLYDDICQYSAVVSGDFALKCTNNFVLLDTDILQSIQSQKSYSIIILPRHLRPNHSKCVWYIHVCDSCKVSIWANKSCYYDYNALLSPDEITRTICGHCIKQQDTDYLQLIKLCPNCRFECNGCKITLCNSHMASHCACCNAKYCNDCINMIGFNDCDYCISSICVYCQVIKVCGSRSSIKSVFELDDSNILNVCKDCSELLD